MGVLVVGMHRSGTSLATALVAAHGARLCRADDLMGSQPDNPRGFYESRSLSDFNELLLSAAGGSWLAPPSLDAPWVSDRMGGHAEQARSVFEAAHTGGGWVWKDPRLCLLARFWRGVLTGPLAAVFVWRSPEEVAASLAERDGLDPSHARRLWSHYNQQAMTGLAGLPTVVSSYGDILADPAGWARATTVFLARHDAMEVRVPEPGEVDALVDPGLRHHESDSQAGAPLAGLDERYDRLPHGLTLDVEGAWAPRVWTDGLVAELGRRDDEIRALRYRLEDGRVRPRGRLDRFLDRFAPGRARR